MQLIFIDEIVCHHGIPLSIISDRGAQFTSRFWRSFQEGLGTKVKLSITFHSQMDGQEEHTIQTLEEDRGSCCSIHPGLTKMYMTLGKCFWWEGLKRT